jgi:hypothetical protein
MCHVVTPCQVSWFSGEFWIYGDLKTKILLTKCFQIAHGSLTKAVCLPNRGWCPPAARAIWVVRSDWPEPKPHGSYVCAVGFSLIEWRSSSLSTAHAVPVVILFISTNCTLNLKNVLNIANDTWNALENQTRGIMVIACRGNFYEAKWWSHRSLEFELTRLLLETMILLVRCSGFPGAIIKTCAKLYQKISTESWEHATGTHRFWWCLDSIWIPCN